MNNRFIPIFMVFSVILGSAFCMEAPFNEKELKGLKEHLKAILMPSIPSDDSLTKLQNYALGKESVQKIIKQVLKPSLFQQLKEDLSLAKAITFNEQPLTDNTIIRSRLLTMLRLTIEKLETITPTNTVATNKENLKIIKKLNRALKAVLTEDNPSDKNIKLVNEFVSETTKTNIKTRCCFGCFVPCIKWLFSGLREQLTRAQLLNLYESSVILLMPLKEQ